MPTINKKTTPTLILTILHICVLCLPNTTRAESLKAIDIIDFIALFSIPHSASYNILSWRTGADNDTPIRWITIGAPNGRREGHVVLSVAGIIPTVLKRTVEPLDWDVTVTGPRSGITEVHVSTPASTQEIQLGPYALMKKRDDVTATIIDCDTLHAASEHTWGVEYQFDSTIKSWMIETMSCGNAGCSLTLMLFTNYDHYKKALGRETRGEMLSGSLCDN